MGQFPTLTVKEMVKDKVVRFTHYREGELWYVTEDGFEFPVPIDDAGNGMFKAEEKAILLMRYIRKRVDHVATWKEEPLGADGKVLTGAEYVGRIEP